MAIDEGSWDGSAGNYSDSQYKAACALDRAVCGGDWKDKPVKTRCSLPYKTPSGTISRAGVHAAAQRIGSVSNACPAAVSAAKAKLRGAYKALGEDAPDSIAASAPRMTIAQIRAAETRRWLTVAR